MMRGASRAFRFARLTWRRLLKDERGSVMAVFVAIPVVASGFLLKSRSAAKISFRLISRHSFFNPWTVSSY